ncbi:MgtC/SapB family protein [Cytophagaceae bacterium ABcell3]|nr:MgtC/SapB family protein [Cytophagaceae bacterium ABcell3]
MDIYDLFSSDTEINLQSIAIRLVMSIVLGGLIGWERETRKQQAGLRTHIIICLGATLLMLISIFIPQTFQNFQNGDPGRIAAQVVSGIGFLGAGAIFSLGGSIRGLTTAATIWVVAAIGLAIGSGMYGGSVLVTLFVLFVLIFVGKLESRFFQEDVLKILQITFSTAKIETDGVFAILDKHKITTQSVNILQSYDKKRSKMKLFVHVPEKINFKALYKDLNGITNVSQISLGQDF